MLWGRVTAGDTVARGRKNRFHQILRNYKGQCSMVSPDTEVEARSGIPSRQWFQAYLNINPEVAPGKTGGGSKIATTVPILEYYWKSVEISLTGHTCKEAKEYFWARCVPFLRMGENPKSENWKTLSWLQEAFASCYSWPRRSYEVLTDRLPKLLHRTFFLFLFWHCKKIKQRNVSCLTLYYLEVRFTSVHQDINCKRLF